MNKRVSFLGYLSCFFSRRDVFLRMFKNEMRYTEKMRRKKRRRKKGCSVTKLFLKVYDAAVVIIR